MRLPGKYKTVGGWTIALAFSFFLNAALFGFMPGLIKKSVGQSTNLPALDHINVIRVKKTETPLRKKEPRKLKKPEPFKQTSHTRTIAKLKQVDLRPRLEFKLNPTLPVSSTDLVMPSLETFSLDAPTLKAHYTVGELDSPLTALVKTPPVYPIRAKRRGIQGYVTVEFCITPHGLVDQIKIIKAEPGTIFNKSVYNCVSRWKFKPGTVEGIPVATQAQTTIRFELEN